MWEEKASMNETFLGLVVRWYTMRGWLLLLRVDTGMKTLLIEQNWLKRKFVKLRIKTIMERKNRLKVVLLLT